MTSDAQTVSKLLSGPEYNWVGEERDNYCVSYTNNSSIGNRYENWHGLWVYKSVDEEKTPKGKVVDTESAHDLIKEYDWRCVFAFIEHGIFVGPATQEALLDCVKLIESTELPEVGGRKSQVSNGMTYVYVTKRTQETWSLQGKSDGACSKVLELIALKRNYFPMTGSTCLTVIADGAGAVN
jgi:hypothetical protein